MTFAPATSLPAHARPAVCRPPRPRRGFTLIELLVVMGIIVLLLALALPAFRFITGSRSAEAAGNQLGAALSVARAQAIGLQQPRGVAIYRDPSNDRSVAVLVELRNAPFAGFGPGTLATRVPYTRGQYAVGGTPAAVYVCTETYSDDGTVAIDLNANWRAMGSMASFIGAPPVNAADNFVEIVPNAEFVTLPAGVDAFGVANAFNWPSSASATSYRYLNPVVIMFDANGQILSAPYYISRQGLLGQPIENIAAAQPGSWSPTPGAANRAYAQPSAFAANYTTATSQVGLVLYDTEIFKNVVGNGTSDAQANWLDQNATPLMINRFNGTLVKGD